MKWEWAVGAEPVAEYDVVFHCNMYGLASIINRKIRDGWEPCGGVAVCGNNYYQAIVRRGVDETEDE